MYQSRQKAFILGCFRAFCRGFKSPSRYCRWKGFLDIHRNPFLFSQLRIECSGLLHVFRRRFFQGWNDRKMLLFTVESRTCCAITTQNIPGEKGFAHRRRRFSLAKPVTITARRAVIVTVKFKQIMKLELIIQSDFIILIY